MNDNEMKKERMLLAEALKLSTDSIHLLKTLKTGMTNRSLVFDCDGHPYILRIPGEGTDLLINRRAEEVAYHAIAGRGLCDEPVYINAASGYKITKYYENARVCDPSNPEDVKRCILLLKSFHEMNIQTSEAFDIFGQIDFYESLWGGKPSMHEDYFSVKKEVLGLRDLISEGVSRTCLTHVDAVSDNFLFIGEGEDTRIQLTDWEYAAMQDPHLDLAMFCIYSSYDRLQADMVMEYYFGPDISPVIRRKIYAYMAVGGLLWSNWCEYKHMLGVDFGEYSLKQYSYAVEYSRLSVGL